MPKLHFYYSAMDAGKSTTLLQSSYNYQERGMHTLLLTPIIDTRFGVGKIASRIGLQSDAITFTPQTDLTDFIQHDPTIRCVLIDEAQFLTKAQVWQLTNTTIIRYILMYYKVIIQAMSRVHRIGQKEQVVVVHSVVGNSCESRIAGTRKKNYTFQ